MSIHIFPTCKLLFSACQRELSFLKISWKFGIVVFVSPENRVARGTLLLSHSPVPLAELLPKWGCQGMKEHSSTRQRNLRESRYNPNIQRKFCKLQNVTLEKTKTNLLDYICIHEYPYSHLKEQDYPEKLSYFWENSSFFRVKIYQKAASIPELCPLFFYLIWEAGLFENPNHSYRNVWNTL